MKRLYAIILLSTAFLLSGAVIKESKQGESIDFYTNPSGTILKSLSLGSDGKLDFTQNDTPLLWTGGKGGLVSETSLQFQLDSGDDSSGATFGVFDGSATLGGGTKLFEVDETGEGYFLGNVGIGTDSPDTLGITGKSVDIYSTSDTSNLILSSAKADADNSALGKIVAVNYTNDTNYQDVGMIRFETDGTTANKRGAAAVFYTAPDNSSSLTERMRIDSSGNVGIGTNEPAAKQTIYQTTSGDFHAYQITQSDLGITTSDGFTIVQDDTGNIVFNQREASKFIDFRMAGDSALLIDGNGNVGINRSDPSYLLDVKSAGTGDYLFRLEASDGSKLLTAQETGGGNLNFYMQNADGTDTIVFQSATGADNYFNNGGNVGIGTSTLSEKLHVNGGILVEAGIGGADYNAGIIDYQTGSNTMRLIAAGDTAGDTPFITFNTGVNGGVTPRMTIDSSGNVGIGTSPGTKLHVADAGDCAIKIEATTINAPLLSFTKNGTQKWLLGSDRDSGFYTGTSDTFFIKDAVANVVRMTIDSSGNVGIGVSPSGTYKTQIQGTRALYAFSASNNSTISAIFLKAGRTDGVGGIYWADFIAGDGSDAGGISSSSKAATAAFRAPSDRRIKTNLVPYDDVLNRLLNVELYKWEMKSDSSAKGNGPMAQELYELFPELVIKTDDGKGEELPEGVNPWNIRKDWDYILVKAIQEQQEIINSQKQENQLMKSWICSQPDAPEALCVGF